MKATNKILSVLILCTASIIVSAQNSLLIIPVEVKEFIEKGATAIALETGDLNGDGTKDFILVTEKSRAGRPDFPNDTDDDRSLLILVRDRAGKLSLAKRNEEVVYCRSCSADGRDPFEGIYLRKGGFTVSNYGDSWRRYESYEFNYSRRDRTWQLVRIVVENYRSFAPERVKTKILLPKNFGKIDIKDFKTIALPY